VKAARHGGKGITTGKVGVEGGWEGEDVDEMMIHTARTSAPLQ